MPAQSDQQKRAAAILKRLRKAYPNAQCELNFSNPLELAIGAILSAQCTDKRVNMVTPALFKKYRTAKDWARIPQEVLENEIRSTGFFRNKAKNIRALCAVLDERHGGKVPDNLDVLIQLPGIGRKTANLLISAAYGQPGIIVDTHFKRLSGRLGFTKSDDPDKIEFDLKAIIPEKDWSDWSHVMVFHGRRCCFARKPNCPGCPIKDLCPFFAKNPK
ncbi:MAG: Ultraviolet N-glycosylase/AP lyase [Verrucomicrobia bacterium ADurb.Bin345]|nr:MAG: Ultraviolet N-glycosylase/AP lyase [Verrucomicrobia bacterium ADurb.Bin345]